MGVAVWVCELRERKKHVSFGRENFHTSSVSSFIYFIFCVQILLSVVSYHHPSLFKYIYCVPIYFSGVIMQIKFHGKGNKYGHGQCYYFVVVVVVVMVFIDVVAVKWLKPCHCRP